MARLRYLIPALFLAMACGKEEVDPTALTSNPMDPAYTGPSLVVLDSAYVDTVSNNGVLEPVLFMDLHVDEARFPLPTSYVIYLHDRFTGNSDTLGPIQGTGEFAFVHPFRPVISGTNYCIDVNLGISGSRTATWTLCHQQP